MYGRKPIFLVGVGLFAGGSVLCGLSSSIEELIVFRAVQGLGAGALQPVAITIVGDIFEPAKRARIQGLFSSVWGVCAVVARPPLPRAGRASPPPPRLGRDAHPGRRYQCAACLGHRVRRGRRLDVCSALFLALVGLSGALLLGFFRIERRAPGAGDRPGTHPPTGHRACLALQVLAVAILFGVESYVPPMVQGYHGGSAVAAGGAVATMSIGRTSAAVVGGRWMVRATLRSPILAGSGCVLIGSALLTQTGRMAWLPYTMLASVVIGFGLGFLNTAIIVVVQSSVTWQERGVATGLVQFSRTIGGAVGVGLLGGFLAAAVGPHVSEILDPSSRPGCYRGNGPIGRVVGGRSDLDLPHTRGDRARRRPGRVATRARRRRHHRLVLTPDRRRSPSEDGRPRRRAWVGAVAFPPVQ